MRIHDLRVERFGAWQNLKLESLSDRITVFYGPNEAGKTTLMQFVRGVLYGYAEPSRQKYLAHASGKAGGQLHVTSTLGEYWIRRLSSGAPLDNGPLTIIGHDGTIQPDDTLGALLGDVDEPIFNNVFAVGLREIQELGTLTDTEAADLLYQLTSGLDRVSLVEVIRELESSRNRLLADDDRPCTTTQLLAKRERLCSEIEELKDGTGRWDQLQGQSKQLQVQIAQLEEENKQLQRQSRLFETALSLRDSLVRRDELNRQLETLGPAPTMPPDGLELLAAYNTQIELRQERRKALRGRARKLRQQVRGLQIRQTLWEQAPRIEALGEQQQWVEKLETQIRTLEEESADLEAQCQALREQFSAHTGNKFDKYKEPPQLSPRAFEMLKPQARAVRQAKEALARTEQEIQENRDSASSIEKRITLELASRKESSLTEALETVGERAALLRRRVGLDERLQTMQRNRTELEEESLQSLDRQLLPMGILAGIGVVFVLGIVLILANFLWLSSAAFSAAGWALAGLGILVTGAAALWKVMLERTAAKNLIACNQQIEMLDRQIAQAIEERDALDRELPRGGGPLAARLKAAEQELAELEELVPLDAQRKAALQEAEGSEQRVERLRNEVRSALAGWREALIQLGLPDSLSPKQVKQFAGQRTQSSEAQERLQRVREELDQRRRELNGVAQRVDRLMDEVGLEAAGAPLGEQIRQLLAATREQEAKMAERAQIRRKWRALKKKDTRYARSMARLRRRRQNLLRQAGALSQEHFRRRYLDWEQTHAVRQEHDKLRREIATTLGMQFSESEISACLASDAQQPLDARWEETTGRLDANQVRLKRLLEQRGELNVQLKHLSDDRRLADRQIELGMVEQQLRDALDDWQVRAVTGHLLETLRKEYEEHRQPETLLEASQYLYRLTGGHYVRVWTPIDANVLYVDDHQGKRWTVDLLSRGTREQLFLSLRLAMVALYARRGVQLPLVLDDVLVNFDQLRAKAAAELLRDFAKTGHQLLVFTCHEHVWKMFKTLKADARRLPTRDELLSLPEPAETLEIEEEELVEEPVSTIEQPIVAEVEPVEEEPLEEEAWDEVEEEEVEDELDEADEEEEFAEEELAEDEPAEDDEEYEYEYEYEEYDEEEFEDDEQYEEEAAEADADEEIEASEEDEFEDSAEEELEEAELEEEDELEEAELDEAAEPFDESLFAEPHTMLETGPFGWDVELEEDDDENAEAA